MTHSLSKISCFRELTEIGKLSHEVLKTRKRNFLDVSSNFQGWRGGIMLYRAVNLRTADKYE